MQECEPYQPSERHSQAGASHDVEGGWAAVYMRSTPVATAPTHTRSRQQRTRGERMVAIAKATAAMG